MPERIAVLLDRLPLAVALVDASGQILGRAGKASGVLGAAIPSRDKDRIHRWKFTDRGGSIIAPTDWPSARALRGEINYAGLVGRYQDGGEHTIRVVTIPVEIPDTRLAAVAFIQHIDRSHRAVEGEQSDLEQRFIDTLAKAISGAWQPKPSGPGDTKT